MTATVFVRRTLLPVAAEALFAWHAEPGALERLIPPWDAVEVVEDPGLASGAVVKLRVGVGPFHLAWWARIEEVLPGRAFRDVQIRGPFALWEHTHTMEPVGKASCWLEDRVVYRLPGGFLGRLFGGPFVRRKLRKMFDFRHAVTLRSCTSGSSAPIPSVSSNAGSFSEGGNETPAGALEK